MRILVINPYGGTEFRGRENIERIKRPDTEFDMVNIAEVYPLKNNQFLYFRHMCTDGTLEQVIRAEKAGYDAVFISCNLDIGLYEARSLVNIPVTATLESAALVAHTMGTKFSLITVDDQNGRIQEMMLGQYGLGGKLASQRPIGIDANELYPEKTPEDVVYQKAVEVSTRCVEEDGAEVIIPGCTLIGSLLTHRMTQAVADIGVPILDGMMTGFKMAEMMADLCKLAGVPPASRRGYFQFPPSQDMETLRGFLGR
ncbi:MAG: aspartate/glutamate racemase family protein [Candidatus Latescibacterota bacterium]